jgi:hypothetical protein
MKRLENQAEAVVMTEPLECENCGGRVAFEAPVGASIQVTCPYCRKGSPIPDDVQLRVGGTRIMNKSS